MGGDSSDGDPVVESPIEGQILLVAAAKASVTAERLPGLVRDVQALLGPRLDEYRRGFETIHEADGDWYFLVDPDRWAAIGAELGFDERETDAVRRAHTEQFQRLGRGTDRSSEFETALEIRDPVVIRESGSGSGG